MVLFKNVEDGFLNDFHQSLKSQKRLKVEGLRLLQWLIIEVRYMDIFENCKRVSFLWIKNYLYLDSIPIPSSRVARKRTKAFLWHHDNLPGNCWVILFRCREPSQFYLRCSLCCYKLESVDDSFRYYLLRGVNKNPNIKRTILFQKYESANFS